MGRALLGMHDIENAYIVMARARQQVTGSGAAEVSQLQGQLLEQIAHGAGKQAAARAQRSAACRATAGQARRMRLLCLSDLHVDQGGNLEVLRSVSGTAFLDDVLLIAGVTMECDQGV
ncbi:hypothetical protein HaLaN_03017, partial [Haematococcus lacustris]